MKVLAVALPTDAAYDIAEGRKTTFSVRERPPRKGKIVIFSQEGGDAEHPGLATVAAAELATFKWTGHYYLCRLAEIEPLLPHFPIAMTGTITEQTVPDILIEPYPNKRNIKRWLKS